MVRSRSLIIWFFGMFTVLSNFGMYSAGFAGEESSGAQFAQDCSEERVDAEEGPNAERLNKVLSLAGDHIDDAADHFGVDCRIIAAVIAVEVGGEPTEEAMITAKSPKGALGLMQLKPATGKEMGATKKELYDPRSNVFAGTKYLLKQIDRKGLFKALMAYNVGPTKMEQLVDGGVDPREHKYVLKVLAHARLLGFFIS